MLSVSPKRIWGVEFLNPTYNYHWELDCQCTRIPKRQLRKLGHKFIYSEFNIVKLIAQIITESVEISEIRGFKSKIGQVCQYADREI